MSTLKDRDIELWNAWRKSKSPMDLQALMRQMDGVIQNSVNRWQGAIAREVLELEGQRLAKQAFETYDPKAGTKLSTHLTNVLQKLSRIVYENQNAARLPEYQTLKVQSYMRAQADLEGALGRAPSSTELAHHLAWSQAAVEQLKKQLRRESIESVDLKSLPVYAKSDNDVMVDLVYHDMSPKQKLLFEHTTGYGGAEILSGAKLMTKLKMTQGQLSYEKSKLVSKIKGVLS